MKTFLAVAVALVTIVAAVATQAPPASREDAYRANNRGVAYLEQYNHADAVKQFERALALDPSLALARINLAIAQFYVPDLAAALETAKAAQSASPDAPQPPYILGLIAKSENRIDDAVEAFKRVLTLDTADLGARVNLAQLLMQRRDYAGAVDLLRPAVASEPYHVTALYNLGVALTRAGKTDEGQKAMAEFQKLREGGYGTTFSNNYLEQGRYAEAVASTGAEAELVDRTPPEVKFVSRATLPRAAADPARHPDPALTRALADQGDGITLVDLDADGDLDLIDVTAFTLRAVHQRQGRVHRRDGQADHPAARAEGRADCGDCRRLRQRHARRSVRRGRRRPRAAAPDECAATFEDVDRRGKDSRDAGRASIGGLC